MDDRHGQAADAALIAAARTAFHSVRGNIGDRDSEVFAGTTYLLYEVQYRKHDFGSWQVVYFRDGRSGTVSRLPVTTHGGSTAFANPTLTRVTAPSGRPAVVATMFVPTEGAAPGEAGELDLTSRSSAPTRPSQRRCADRSLPDGRRGTPRHFQSASKVQRVAEAGEVLVEQADGTARADPQAEVADTVQEVESVGHRVLGVHRLEVAAPSWTP